jgi:hypothetical protein
MTMGFWIRPDGMTYEIPDHYNFLLANAKLFGFNPKEAKAWTLADRSDVIKEATRHGWIRVRGKRPHLSMEFWRPDGNTLHNIKEFLIKQGIDPNEQILFEENAGEGSWYQAAEWVLSDEALVLAGGKKAKSKARG